MSDRTAAQLEIGGDITRDRVGALATLLEKRVGRNVGEPAYTVQIEAAAAAGECLFIEEDEVDFLEQFKYGGLSLAPLSPL